MPLQVFTAVASPGSETILSHIPTIPVFGDTPSMVGDYQRECLRTVGVVQVHVART